MTIAERKDKLKHFIICLKCEVSGKCCDDNCPTQYDAGNMGEIIENLEVISKALEREPCEDAISRQAVLKQLKGCLLGGETEYKYVKLHIDSIPPAIPQPKTGQRLCKTCIYGDKTEYDKPCIIYSDKCQLYRADDVLDKIRAEIEEIELNITYQENKDRKATWGLRKALEIIDKYKIESEDKK